jgi:DNA polymerase V
MMYALVDCNNFFVSCERAFQPDLEGKAVVVLSNNDGCVVARSNESKKMGIAMGTPFFKVKSLVDAHQLYVRSSNYTLYGDLSARVMSILSSAAPKLEIYSIDEAFMIMDGLDEENMVQVCRALVVKIRKWVGIPVSIGIAPTKTLAKIANHFAKRYPAYKGVCTIDNEDRRVKALSLTTIDDVWGIGWRGAPKLAALGVHTADDFARKPKQWIQKRMGVTGIRTWMELNGQVAVEEELPDKRKSICTSRSFAEMIPDEKELSLRISDFAAMCAHKLRDEGSAAYTVSVFMQTNHFRPELVQYDGEGSLHLAVAASSAPEIVGAALRVMRTIFRDGCQYKRAGVIVTDIVDAQSVQTSLFDYDQTLREKEDKLSQVMDEVNVSGRSMLRLATQRPGHYADGIRSDYRSRLYSTSWDEMMEVH